MKNYALIIGSILLTAIIFLMGYFFFIPTEAATTKQVKALEYQQKGNFDYAVTVKPAYFYDGLPVPTQPTSPQIPVNYIKNFDLKYSYNSESEIINNIQINAILESPGAWVKTINLASFDNVTATVNTPLDLPYFIELANTIEKEIGNLVSSHTLTLQAIVDEGTSSNFVQMLPIKMTRTYIKIGDYLQYSMDRQEGTFDYQIELTENSLFGAVTLTPPASAVERDSVTLGVNDTVFSKLIDTMNVKFSYNLVTTRPALQSEETVTIEAILESPDKWSKSYTLVPPTKETGEFTIYFPLDVAYFSSIFDTIQKETGVTTSTQNLIIKATVSTKAQMNVGVIDQVFSHSIKANLKDGILSWGNDLGKSVPGAIETSMTVMEPVIVLKLPVSWWRIIISSLFVIILAGLIIYYLTKNKWKRFDLDEAARVILRKYKQAIVEVKQRPEPAYGMSVLRLDLIEDLMKVSQGLLKPVHHHAGNDYHIFWVNDDTIRYEFLLTDPRRDSEIFSNFRETPASPPS